MGAMYWANESPCGFSPENLQRLATPASGNSGSETGIGGDKARIGAPIVRSKQYSGTTDYPGMSSNIVYLQGASRHFL